MLEFRQPTDDRVNQQPMRRRRIEVEVGDMNADVASPELVEFDQGILGAPVCTVQVPYDENIAWFQGRDDRLVDGPIPADRRKSLDMQFVTNGLEAVNLSIGALFRSRYS